MKKNYIFAGIVLIAVVGLGTVLFTSAGGNLAGMVLGDSAMRGLNTKMSVTDVGIQTKSITDSPVRDSINQVIQSSEIPETKVREVQIDKTEVAAKIESSVTQQSVPAETTQSNSSVTAQGFLSIFHEDDFAHKKSIDRAVVFTSDKKAIALDYEKVKARLPETGSYIKLSGLEKNSAGKYSFNTIETIRKPVTTSNRSAGGPTGNVSVVLMNYLDDTSTPFTTADIRKKVFDIDPTAHFSVPNWFRTVSYGIMNLVGKTNPTGVGDVHGWYTTNYNHATCQDQDTHAAILSALATAKNNGLVVNKDDIVIFWQPYNSHCPYLGFATAMPLDPTNQSSDLFRYVMMNGSATGTLLHELGHLMGPDAIKFIRHASRYRCLDASGMQVAFNKVSMVSCEVEEYADFFNVMGVADGYDYFGNTSRLEAGFLSANNYINAQVSGTYEAVPTNTLNAKVIKIPMSVYLADGTLYSNSEGLYTVETRVFDPLVETQPPSPQLNWLFVRQDNKLVTTGTSWNILHPGESFIDEKNNVTIKNVGASSAGSANTLVQVTMPAQPLTCRMHDPKLTVTPQQAMGVYPQTLVLSVKVKNMDTVSCSAAYLTVGVGNSQSLYPFHTQNYYTPELSYLETLIATGSLQAVTGYYMPGQEKTATISIPVTQNLAKSLLNVKFYPGKARIPNGSLWDSGPASVYVGFGNFTQSELRSLIPISAYSPGNIFPTVINPIGTGGTTSGFPLNHN